MAWQSQGPRGIVKLMLLVARGKAIYRLKSPCWRPLTSALRVALNKRYGSPFHYDGKKFGFSNILEACEFFSDHVAQSS